MNFPQQELNLDTVTHPSTNRANVAEGAPTKISRHIQVHISSREKHLLRQEAFVATD